MEKEFIVNTFKSKDVLNNEIFLSRAVPVIETLNEKLSEFYNRERLDKYLKTISRTDATIIKIFNTLNTKRLDVCSFVPEKIDASEYLINLGYEFLGSSNLVEQRNGLIFLIMAFTSLSIPKIIRLTQDDVIKTNITYIDGYVTPNIINHNHKNIVYMLSSQYEVIDEQIKNPKHLYNHFQKILDKTKKDVIIWNVENPSFEWEKK
jgi:hypothetical protein